MSKNDDSSVVCDLNDNVYTKKGGSSLSTSAIQIFIERINELSRKKRTVGLEEWEAAEQEALRQEYLTFIREQVKETLSNVQVEEDSPLQ